MKFSNGYWRMRDGVTPMYPMEVRDVQVTGDALTVYAPTKRILTRGDTLNLPLLTVRASSPRRASSRSGRRTSRGGVPAPPPSSSPMAAPTCGSRTANSSRR